ncbi:MAG: DUF5011 domain-containing protein [Polaribacter sp.]|nr:DUF5011 domain-containing protein [Polaribacter sp.]MDG1810923.1 DUF5011 domain-containing protein [Polaribacter sp.]MDG1994036.1 DUF5011 domain-containing protein [Polaribacter sp.]
MKKYYLILLVGLIVSCSNEIVEDIKDIDTTIPVITLLGDNPMTIEVGNTYIDAGAKAIDNSDGDISSNIIIHLHLKLMLFS